MDGELLKALQDYTDGGWHGGDDDSEVSYEGEHADGEPSWLVMESCIGGGYSVERVVGWYEQRGDADDAPGVIRLMRAMDAAAAALNEAHWALNKALQSDEGGE